ncbi:ComEA family DNA-binding protein [Nocardioides sp. zg-DK7169]|uniref:ComEA family DNA-binding protein n=1 Tax=Nocardioides sp. zg-DK7169 TaxID=2736600 RepID=UPI0015527DDB|nr:ComEA family DNA-binding protein [Nocardioides sp. zg-DK7169]NPC98381.1 ComEA family DNA-binding protein [Nocardioides sp. zg-DK7169]
MRSRRTHPEHEAAVARRLAVLGAELAGARAASDPDVRDDVETDEEWWREHTHIGPPAAERATWGELRSAADTVPDLGSEPVGADPAPWGPSAAPVPVPGRHASRRRGAGIAALVPDPLRGRAGLGAGAVAVVAVLVAVGLAVTAWWVVRSDSSESVGRLAAADASPIDGSGGGPGTAVPSGAEVGGAVGAASPSGQSGTVTVDVAGRVRRPGIAVLPAGSRVVDALEAVGGARPGVDLVDLNLARVLVDGEQVLVGVEAPSGVAASSVGGPTAPGTASVALVNINLASQAELETLPGVGPVTAGAIIGWREENGGFSAVEELLEVDGIGEVTLSELAPLVTV